MSKCLNCLYFDGYDAIRTDLTECTLYGLTSIDESLECLTHREKIENNIYNQILYSTDSVLNEYKLSQIKVIK